MSLTSNISANTSSNRTCRGVLESSWRAYFKTVIGFQIWSRFNIKRGQKQLLQSKGSILYPNSMLKFWNFRILKTMHKMGLRKDKYFSKKYTPMILHKMAIIFQYFQILPTKDCIVQFNFLQIVSIFSVTCIFDNIQNATIVSMQAKVNFWDVCVCHYQLLIGTTIM